MRYLANSTDNEHTQWAVTSTLAISKWSLSKNNRVLKGLKVQFWPNSNLLVGMASSGLRVTKREISVD